MDPFRLGFSMGLPISEQFSSPILLSPGHEMVAMQ
jgi:hypothetical protein